VQPLLGFLVVEDRAELVARAHRIELRVERQRGVAHLRRVRGERGARSLRDALDLARDHGIDIAQ
jgi:hypothetical protein